jgi:hypothetical protein
MILILTVISCKKNSKELDSVKQENATSESVSAKARVVNNIPYRQSEIILGQPKQNPYTVQNMQLAFVRISKQGIQSNVGVSITTSHYYIKFKPNNIFQYEALKVDSTISLQDFPIESTIIQNGNKYHDPSLPNDVPTYQYGAVPLSYQLPDSIPYEILGDLYIPEQDADVNNSGNSTFFNKLLDQAYIQTGNFEDTIKIPDLESRYRPGGRLQTFDTRLGQLIGAEGVRMEARRWFVVFSAITDVNGNYRMALSFNRPCNYSAWFANPFFAVRENLFGLTSWINGPKLEGDWNHNILDGYDRFVSHIYRGAVRYNFKNIGGLQRPWILFVAARRQIYIAVDGNGNQQGINWMVLPIIRIWRFVNDFGTEFQSDEIFSTTCHETAHTSHVLRMNGGLIQYWQVERRLQESWCIAIEWFLSGIEYRERGIANYGQFNYFPANPPGFPNSYAYQYWSRVTGNEQNTPIYIDIVDNHNQLGVPYLGFGVGDVEDVIQDYTLPFIESFMLRNIYGHASLSRELKAHKPASVTDAQIDAFITSLN